MTASERITQLVREWNPKIGQVLVTDEDVAALPHLYSQDGKGMDATAHLKFFGTGGRWTWFATEASPIVNGETKDSIGLSDCERAEEIEDVLFFGYVHSGLGKDCDELCYFQLSQLCEVGFPPFDLPIERDDHWTATTLREVAA